jgi:starch synthase (maltosyl-transferring)
VNLFLREPLALKKDVPMNAENALRRIVIEEVKPEINAGRFAIKRTVGEKVWVTADIYADGHDALSTLLLYRRNHEAVWHATPMKSLVNDRWVGFFGVEEIGQYLYTLQAWVDRFKTLSRDIEKKVAAGQEVAVDFLIVAKLIAEAGSRAAGDDAAQLQKWGELLKSGSDMKEKLRLLKNKTLRRIMTRYADRELATVYDKHLPVTVEREKARFSTWYEMFPRSCAAEPNRHGTFKDCQTRLPYIAKMGFDVLYLPPIHPIGRTHRKGKNNSPQANPQDVGSPWAIGAQEGGHRAVHPQLGSLEDFRQLVSKAREYGLEIALDMAFQCTPDHPYVKEHPEWFRRRPDGKIQYAENPPKKYEDIYPFEFESDRRQELWEELLEVVRFWIDQGVHIFRVDNPHTKPFAFWEWLITEIKKDHPETIFLSEAFTRPKVMYRLAKLGFTQSYTYFTWRNTKWELSEYFSELSATAVREFFRPNLWPNTPDILTQYLQMGGRPAFMTRLVLAATLGASYGIYGPAFELCENAVKEAGSEEYMDSEKYQIRHWDIDRADNLKAFIERINRIRRENPALQNDWSLRFHPLDNEQLICYSKHNEDFSNIILVAVNLDPHHTHSGWLEFPVETLKLDPQQPFQVHDLLGNARYLWRSGRNFVEVNPQAVPAQIFLVRRRVRTERDFDYFM